MPRTKTPGASRQPMLMEAPKREGAYPIKDVLLKCAEKVAKDNMKLSYPVDWKLPDSPFKQFLFAGGNNLEAADYQVILDTAVPGTVAYLHEELDENGERTSEGKAKLEKDTFDAMCDPKVQVILNARLAAPFDELLCQERGITPRELDPWRTSQPDVLVMGPREEGSRLPKWVLPVDIKDHKVATGTAAGEEYPITLLPALALMSGATMSVKGTLRVEDQLQLVHYTRHLEKLGLSHPEPWGAIIGREGKAVWALLDVPRHTRPDGSRVKVSALELYDEAFSLYKDVLANAQARDTDPSVPAMTYPEWKGECKECPWKQVCEDELVAHGDGGHITLLPGITPAKASGHYNAGISSIRELARLDIPTAAAIEAGVAVSDISNPDLNTARYAGKGVKDLTKAIYQARVTLAGKVARAPGVDVVDLPRFDVEVDFDLENTNAPVFPGRDKDGKHSGGPLAYLWGTRTTRRTRKRDGTVTHTVKVQQFTDWTDSDEGEMLAFVQFWDFISDSRSKALSKKKTWGAFHYSSVEPTWMRKLAGKYAGKPGVPTLDEVEDLLSSGDVIDMYVILSRQLVWPTRDHSIKSLAKWARFSWRAEDAGGDNSMLWHRASVCDPDPMERKRNQKRLLDYNVDDVAAQEHLRSWIEKLQSAENAKVRIPSVSAIRRPLPRR